MVKNTHQPTNNQHIAQALQQGHTLITVSDGLFHPDLQHGTAAWIIWDENTGIEISGNNIVPGRKDIQCSHRSELSGLIGAIHHINTICKQ